MAEDPSSSGGASSIDQGNDDDNSFSEGSSDGENQNPNFANVVIPPETVRVARLLIKSQPLKKTMRKVRTKNRTPEEMDSYKMEMEAYLHDLFDLPFCFSRYWTRFTSCCCLHMQRENCLFPAVMARLGKFFFCSPFYHNQTNLPF
jgi:hypothetical protein